MQRGTVLYARKIVFKMPGKADNGVCRVNGGTQEAHKGRLMAFLLLGTVGEDGSDPIDVNQWLIELGWTPPASVHRATHPHTTPETHP